MIKYSWGTMVSRQATKQNDGSGRRRRNGLSNIFTGLSDDDIELLQSQPLQALNSVEDDVGQLNDNSDDHGSSAEENVKESQLNSEDGDLDHH